MNKLYQGALLCAVAAFVAGCGGNTSSTGTSATSTAATVVTGGKAAQTGTQQSDYNNVTQKIYLAYFGRPADVGGLDWFTGVLLAFGAPTDVKSVNDRILADPNLAALVDVFSNSQESKDLYAGDDVAFVTAVYRNLFSREPDTAGRDYWVGQIQKGVMTRARASLNILASAQGTDIDIINAKAAASTAFTNALDLGPERRAYSGLTANATVRTMLGTVNAQTDLNAFNTTIANTINQLVANAPPSAQGMYHGMLPGSGNTDINFLVLDDDTVWTFYGAQRLSQYDVWGYGKAAGASNGSVLTGVMKDFGSGGGVDEPISFNYSVGGNLSGTITTRNGPVSVTASPVASAQYDYNAAADLSKIAGGWTMNGRINAPVTTVNIDAQGALVGTVADGCTFVGTLQPRPAKNVFDLTINYGANCALSGRSITGVGVTFLSSNGANRELVLLGSNGSANAGAEYWGIKPAQ